MSGSCVGCKFLCAQERGYSNYTVEETETFCALDKNPRLPAESPWNWMQGKTDMWPITNESRCESYSEGESAHFDVEGETTIEDYKDDPELYEALKEYLK